ncbi:MAG: hypothetical protein F9K32_09905 [Desulfobulbaceae bacterium]|nr:MAG: hypothetical protein F9K32_09905 [Desulfobulbaceae bacterium]
MDLQYKANREQTGEVGFEQKHLDVETLVWLNERICELEERFSITSPDLLAQVLGFPEELIALYLAGRGQ